MKGMEVYMSLRCENIRHFFYFIKQILQFLGSCVAVGLVIEQYLVFFYSLQPVSWSASPPQWSKLYNESRGKDLRLPVKDKIIALVRVQFLLQPWPFNPFFSILPHVHHLLCASFMVLCLQWLPDMCFAWPHLMEHTQQQRDSNIVLRMLGKGFTAAPSPLHANSFWSVQRLPL